MSTSILQKQKRIKNWMKNLKNIQILELSLGQVNPRNRKW
jgi:hypothetical protein